MRHWYEWLTHHQIHIVARNNWGKCNDRWKCGLIINWKITGRSRISCDLVSILIRSSRVLTGVQLNDCYHSAVMPYVSGDVRWLWSRADKAPLRSMMFSYYPVSGKKLFVSGFLVNDFRIPDNGSLTPRMQIAMSLAHLGEYHNKHFVWLTANSFLYKGCALGVYSVKQLRFAPKYFCLVFTIQAWVSRLYLSLATQTNRSRFQLPTISSVIQLRVCTLPPA